jgi:hypothetical protein
MNKVWDAWVPAGCAPARACIEALLQGPEKKVEIQVTGGEVTVLELLRGDVPVPAFGPRMAGCGIIGAAGAGLSLFFKSDRDRA